MIENIVLAITSAFTEFTQGEAFTSFMSALVAKIEAVDLQSYITKVIEYISSLIL